MDVNVALANMRLMALEAFLVPGNADPAEMAEQFSAIDEWMSKGGFSPDAWNHDQRKSDRRKGN